MYFKRAKTLQSCNIENQINLLQQLSDMSPKAETFTSMLIEKKAEQEMLRKDYMKGLIIRGKAKWIEDGEKPSNILQIWKKDIMSIKPLIK